jgi:hypothetical protein
MMNRLVRNAIVRPGLPFMINGLLRAGEMHCHEAIIAPFSGG